MNKEVQTLLNQQVQKELYSAYLYFDMANYYSAEGLGGFSNWFYVQAQEEMSHAMLMRDYLLNNDEAVTLLAIEAPKGGYTDFMKPLTESLKHEQNVTSSINAIYGAALGAKDYRTVEFLNWFIREQGEEEKNAQDLIRKYELFGKDAKGLYALDQELAARTYAPPSLALD